MDPVSVITGALLAGAAAGATDVTSQAIKDAYGKLKDLIVRKFGGKADVANAVGQLEAKPDSKARQGMVQEEIEGSGAAEDEEIVAQAQALLDLLKQQGALTGAQYTAIVTGSGAIAQGPGAVAAGAGGIAVGGSVEGGIHSSSKPKSDDEEDNG